MVRRCSCRGVGPTGGYRLRFWCRLPTFAAGTRYARPEAFFVSFLIPDGPLIEVYYLPMTLSTQAKEELFAKHSLTKTAVDTGSAESQIALFTARIIHLTEHLKSHKKDHSTRLGLLKLVGKRRRLLNHLMNTEINRYRAIIAELGIRK
jgi:small subunit ribosomal protein S15